MNNSQKEYINRINKVVDYIENNMSEQLSLQKISEVAHFSPFHFHRIFAAFTGETLNNFIKRKRIEKAARILIIDQEKSISEIAYECGYSSPSVFCRNFKDRFKLNANEFRENKTDKFSKIRQLESKIDKSTQEQHEYIRIVEILKEIRMKKNIAIKDMPALNLLYVRHIGAFDQIRFAYDKLMKWAGPRGLLNFPKTQTVTVYHDDPSITDIEKLQQSACITVDQDVKPEGEVGYMSLPASKCVVGHFDISVKEFEKSWESVCVWMAENGYQPGGGLPYELYYDHEGEEENMRFVLDICIPIKPL
ncbi:MAG: AraC family transcriptional regulator [Chloroflexia bacterium]|nr:AraC family transcriptional regulator [Chloroflexia bacterium]